jgi:hypothetical protein
MDRTAILADSDHPLVSGTALQLTENVDTPSDQLEKLFFFVRDGIRFGFQPHGDLMRASETIRLGMGQCNNKTTLLVALSRSLGFPARVHFSLIRREIQRGLFPSLAYLFLPRLISHSWAEVEVDGRWRRLDSYINDLDFYRAGRAELRCRGWNTGFSIACSAGESIADFDIDRERFVQMDAVVEDHGVWQEPADYYRSALYRNRPSAFRMLLYRIVLKAFNQDANWLIALKVDPFFANLRPDARYQQLLRRMNFPGTDGEHDERH